MDAKKEAQAYIEARGGEFAALSHQIWEYAELFKQGLICTVSLWPSG